MRLLLIALSLILLAAIFTNSTVAQTPAPALFYSDLDSGPNAGGENNAGVYVTIYGARFGASQGAGYVAIGGGRASSYPVWSDSSVTFQIGSGASTGSIAVTTSAGTSNGIPFIVRPGNIYFVSSSGSDSNSGLFGSPWLTLPYAVQTIAAGDTIYAMNGVTQSVDDGQGWDAALTFREQWCGASGYNRAVVAYPGALVTIGNANGPSPTSGIRTTDFSADGGACGGYWTFAGITFRGLSPITLAGPSQQWRVIGNDISCPNTDGSGGGGACFGTSLASNVKFLGNHVHDAGTTGASALFQGVYFSTDSNHIEMGWNTVANVHGCRGVQVHSSPLGSGYPNSGYSQYDIQIHDNVIHDTQCDGIIVDTIDPSQGAVRIYNNVIYNAGIGPNNPEGSGDWACIFVPGGTESGTPGSGIVEVDNNTLYGCGTFSNPPYDSANAAVIEGGSNANLFVRLRDNLIYQLSSEPYLVVWNPVSGEVCAPSDNCPWMQGTNNLFFGSGTQQVDTINVLNSINADPRLIAADTANFQLASSSPARGAGVNTGISQDINGILRGGSEGYDIGAYQFYSVSPVIGAITDAASFAVGSTSPGELAVCFGTNLGPTSAALARVSNGVVTNSIGGVQVLVNGVQSPLLYAQANQINFVMPYEVSGSSTASVQVTYAGQASNALTVPVAPTSPNIFTIGAAGYGQGAILNQNLSINSIVNPAHVGEVIAIYATGAGQTSPMGVDGLLAVATPYPVPQARVSVTIGGVQAEVNYAGAAPSLIAGTQQINVVIPQGAPSGNTVPVVVTVGNASSQSNVTVAIQ